LGLTISLSFKNEDQISNGDRSLKFVFPEAYSASHSLKQTTGQGVLQLLFQSSFPIMEVLTKN